jgi:Ethanolamine utilization protein
MKKVMVIGAIDSGKTSLLMALNGESGEASKTQTLIYNSMTIDTPGEYIENPRMYKALLSTSLEAGCILFTQDSTVDRSIFPPGFACSFNAVSIGVITKIDHENADIEKARNHLQKLSLKGPIFQVSALTGEGIDTIRDFLKFNL